MYDMMLRYKIIIYLTTDYVSSSAPASIQARDSAEKKKQARALRLWPVSVSRLYQKVR
jgi:hypothetical protein